MHELHFRTESRAGSAERIVAIRDLIVAGWTGRDREKMEEHIRELEALGVKRPAAVPFFYRVAARRLTSADAIQVSGTDSSGEAEMLLVNDGGDWWVGLASDHTDRKVEAYGVTVSKQMCDKPCAPVLWPFVEVAENLDRLALTSAIDEGGWTEYQRGTLAAIQRPEELVARYVERHGPFDPGSAMLCGTVPAIGGVRAAPAFRMALEDPVLGRRIEHSYAVDTLPITEG